MTTTISFPVGKYRTKGGREAEVFAVVTGHPIVNSAGNQPIALGVIYTSKSGGGFMHHAWNATDGNRWSGAPEDNLVDATEAAYRALSRADKASAVAIVRHVVDEGIARRVLLALSDDPRLYDYIKARKYL